MPDDARCEALLDALVEVSLGIASGDDRARVLGHVAACPSCQRLLGQLTDTSDELLQLAPVSEPAPGFELRVLSGIDAPAGPRRRWGLRIAPALAAAVAATALSVTAVLVATRDERRLGQQLAVVLDRAQGNYIAASELRDARRRKLGVVFHYGGRPSWIFTTLDRPLGPGTYRATLVTRSGAVRALGTFVLGAGDRGFGSTVQLDLRDVAQLRLRDERRGMTYVADF